MHTVNLIARVKFHNNIEYLVRVINFLLIALFCLLSILAEFDKVH